MHAQDTLDRLDRLIQSRSILRHPFYVAWQRGELIGEQLAIYAQVYYPHVASFPGYLRAAIDSAVDPLVRAELACNLVDELANPKNRAGLWLDLAEGFGLDRQEVVATPWSPAARDIVSTFERLARDGSAGALAALYAYESQQSEVARQKADGLQKFYGVESPAVLAYFEVHAEADVHHREGERQALVRCQADGATQASVLGSAKQALEVYWGLLDGICVEAGIPLDC